jgi:hypothetical protein
MKKVVKNKEKNTVRRYLCLTSEITRGQIEELFNL